MKLVFIFNTTLPPTIEHHCIELTNLIYTSRHQFKVPLHLDLAVGNKWIQCEGCQKIFVMRCLGFALFDTPNYKTCVDKLVATLLLVYGLFQDICFRKNIAIRKLQRMLCISNTYGKSKMNFFWCAYLDVPWEVGKKLIHDQREMRRVKVKPMAEFWKSK